MAEAWLEKLLSFKDIDDTVLEQLCGQLAARTKPNELNLSDHMVDRIKERFTNVRLRELLTKDTDLSLQEKELLLIDQLPIGLIIQ